MTAHFSLGHVIATPGALSVLRDAQIDPVSLLVRHQGGDWGQVPADDARENNYASQHGFRVISSYPAGDDMVWVITGADRSQTCLLLPSEY